ncbi:HPr family phosphocarrier protein [Pseudalkalibacillus caeni]|uniref:HPr family phosphocarrier protein n=1 Tax=Exobacillus caeni TaxID=2574798 RepID=UPI0014853ACF|nr:HPr family phosphocarrier protein [Pseudalkalibacillus caeni]
MDCKLKWSLTKKVNRAFLMALVETANLYESYIVLEMDKKRVNAKSLLSVGGLVGYRGIISIHATGRDCEQAINGIETLLEKFGALE